MLYLYIRFKKMSMAQEEYERKRDLFVERFVPYLREHVPAEEIVRGVSFLPIVEEGDGIVLGKENDGYYKGKWNFFGGSLQDKSSNRLHPTYEDIARGLFEEVAEEFGVILKASSFQKSLMDIYHAVMRKKDQSEVSTLMFLVKYKDFSPELWREHMSKRNNEKKCWREHDDAIAMREDELKFDEVSSFVRGYISRLYLRARTKWNAEQPGISYHKQEKIVSYM